MLLRKQKSLFSLIVLLAIAGLAACSSAPDPTPIVVEPTAEPTSVPTVAPTATPIPPTPVPPTETPTEAPIILPTETPIPPTEVPTEAPTEVPTEVPPTETPMPTATPELSGFDVPAVRPAALFRAPDLEAETYSEFVAEGDTARIVGISPNWYWLLVQYSPEIYGWAASDRFDLEGVSLSQLTVSEYQEGDSYAILLGTPDPDAPPQPTPVGNVLYDVFVVSDAALFAGPSVADGRTGYFIPASNDAGVVGRSEDSAWVHVVSALGKEGWVDVSFLDLDSTSLSELPISDYAGAANTTIAAVPPTAVPTIWPTHTATPNWPTRTPTPNWPTRTPTPQVWPTQTPAPAVAQATAVPAATMPPSATEPASATEAPAATAMPAATEAPLPTETLMPTETPLPTVTPTPAPTEIPSTDAIASWKVLPEFTVASFGGWDTAIEVRVPTGGSYVFEIDFGRSTSLFDRGGGFDTYLVTISGIPCGTFTAELVALQNGLKMQIRDAAGNPGDVVIGSPC